MVKTVTLKKAAPKLNRMVSLIEDSLNQFVNDEPVNLYLNMDDYGQFEKTIRILFDKASVEKIEQARKEVSGSI